MSPALSAYRSSSDRVLHEPQSVEFRPDIEVVMDISRLLSRVLHTMPTGIDRVEMRYARELLEILGPQLTFAAVNPMGVYGRIDRNRVVAFLDRTEVRWRHNQRSGRMAAWRNAVAEMFRLWPKPVRAARRNVARYYVQASPHHLHRPEIVRKKLQIEAARFVCLVHDLIPIEFPEYARPNGAHLHALRMQTMIEFADGLVANSEATARSTKKFAHAIGREPVIWSAHLGTERIAETGEPEFGDSFVPAKPYFLVISTIEPRKNHLLLLNIWRRMVEDGGAEEAPMLVIVGRRGWENENVVDMLERCPALRDSVVEYSGLPDNALAPLIRSARAVLCPSFAEGFGMPVTEALAMGTPVICSDLPALREAGCGIPDYLDPLDGPAWIDLIADYADELSPARRRQIERMTGWEPPTWTAHIKTVLGLITAIDESKADE